MLMLRRGPIGPHQREALRLEFFPRGHTLQSVSVGIGSLSSAKLRVVDGRPGRAAPPTRPCLTRAVAPISESASWVNYKFRGNRRGQPLNIGGVLTRRG